MNNASNTKLNFPLKRWVIYNFLGWVLGTILVVVLSSTLDAIGIEDLQFFVAVGIGSGIGIAQWLILKNIININKSWIIITVVGLTIPFLITDGLRYFEVLNLRSFSIPVCVGIGSLIVGFLQSRILKQYSIELFNWMIISFFSWILMALAVYCVEYTYLISRNAWFGFITNLILLLSGGLIIGIITGKHLKRNLH